jgi:hypothetical protein
VALNIYLTQCLGRVHITFRCGGGHATGSYGTLIGYVRKSFSVTATNNVTFSLS